MTRQEVLPKAYQQGFKRDILRDFVRVGDRSGQNAGGELSQLFTVKIRSPFRAWSLPCERERTLEWVVRGSGRPWRARKTRPHQLCRSEPYLSGSETKPPPRAAPVSPRRGPRPQSSMQSCSQVRPSGRSSGRARAI